jgi:hypothetical protein
VHVLVKLLQITSMLSSRCFHNINKYCTVLQMEGTSCVLYCLDNRTGHSTNRVTPTVSSCGEKE